MRHSLLRSPAVWLMCAGALLVLASASGAAERLPKAQHTVWETLNNGLLPHVTVTSLAVDPQNAGRIYAGTTGAAGVWISDDGGLSGHFEGGLLAGRVAYAFSVDPARPDEILAGTDAGLYRSTDAGRTWQREEDVPVAAILGLARDAEGRTLAGGAGPQIYHRAAGQHAGWQKLAPLPETTSVLSLAASPRGGLILAGTDGAGLFRSRDGGRTWEVVTEIGQTFVAGLLFLDHDGRAALARTRMGLYATSDGGENWRLSAEDVPGRIDALLEVEPGTVYLGTSEGTLYRREPGSESWQRWGAGIGVPGLFSSLLVASGTRWYAGTSNGLYLSDDAGLTWRMAQPGPGRPMATALAMTAGNSLLLANNGVYRFEDAGQWWQPRTNGLPPDTILALAPATGNPDLIYAGLAGQGVYRSQDGGLSWTSTGWTKHGAPAVLVDPSDPLHLYIRVTYERVYESRDGGATWNARWDGLGLSTQIVSLAMDPERPSILYAGGTEGFFRSLDGAALWQSVGPELSGQTVFSIIIDPRNGRHLYAGATNGAFRSEDGGEHWERWGLGLEDTTVTALTVSRQDPRLAFAGTKYRGVFQSQDGGQHWQYAGPEPVSVNALLLTPDGRWLYAATAVGVHAMQVQTR